MTQVLTGGMSQISRIKVAFFRSHLFLKEFTHLFPFDVDGRQHDMTRFEMHQLQNTLAQIGLHDIDTTLHQERIQPTFLCEHGFTFDKMMHIMFIQYLVHNGTIFISVFRPMHDSAIGGSILFKLQQELFEMAVGI